MQSPSKYFFPLQKKKENGSHTVPKTFEQKITMLEELLSRSQDKLPRHSNTTNMVLPE